MIEAPVGNTVDEMVADGIKKIKAKHDEVDERVKGLKLIYHDAIVVERLDISLYRTSIFSDPMADKERKRVSWYGRVLKKAEHLDGHDEVAESLTKAKKKLINVGDFVLFNPDAPFSLNVLDFEYEIWVMQTDNIIVCDEKLKAEYWPTLEKALRTRAEILFAAKEAKEAADKAAKDSGLVGVTLDKTLIDPNFKPISPLIRVSGSEKEAERKYRDFLEQKAAENPSRRR